MRDRDGELFRQPTKALTQTQENLCSGSGHRLGRSALIIGSACETAELDVEKGIHSKSTGAD